MDELENEKVRVIYAETQQGGRTSGRNDERRPSEFISSWATPFVFIVHQPSIASPPPLSDSRPAPSVGSEFHCSHARVATRCQTERDGVQGTAPPEVRPGAPPLHFLLKMHVCLYFIVLIFSTVGGSNKEAFCLWIKIRIPLFIKNGGKYIVT